MDEYPKMLYSAGGVEEIHDGLFTTCIVANADEEAAALADGFFLTTTAATEGRAALIAANAKAIEAEAAEALADATNPPTREELEQMAGKLGIPYSARVSDKKLRALIEAAAQE